MGYGWTHISNIIMIPPTPFSFQYCRASFVNIENLLYSNAHNQCKQNPYCILSTSCRPVTFVRRGGARVFAWGGGGMPRYFCASADKGGGVTPTNVLDINIFPKKIS